MDQTEIIVGVDGSASAERALLWAEHDWSDSEVKASDGTADELGQRHQRFLHESLDSHGRSVTIRPAVPQDRDLLSELSNALSPRSVYLRFFSSSRSAAERYLSALADPSQGARATLLAIQGGDLVGVAAFEPIDATQAELSVLVSDSHQHCGIGTLLIESLVDHARARGFSRFVAEVLAENGPMLTVLRDLGLRFGSSIHWGVDTITIDIEQIGQFTAARAERERASTVESLERGTAKHP